MYLLRRNSVAMLAAFAFVLGACSSEPAPTEPQVPTTGDIGENPLLIQINPGAMVFSSITATPPAPQTLAVSGLVAIGSAVSFGTPSYGQAVQPWVRVNPTPTFQRTPLAWLHTVSIDGAAFAALPNGAYTAMIPVIVAAAQNSPQMLQVVLCKGTTQCLAFNSSGFGALGAGDGIWDRSTIFGGPADPNDLEYYDDWVITLQPGQWTYVQMLGDGCGGSEEQGGTLEDPYLVAYLGPIGDVTDYYDYNDDSDCLNSEVLLSNMTAGPLTWYLRASSYDEYDDDGFGTYTLRASQTPIPDGRFDPGLRAEGSPAPAHPQRVAKLND